MINEWAKQWGIPQAAMDALWQRMGIAPIDPPTGDPRSEAYVQSAVRLGAVPLGATLWRNNVGAAQMPDGSHVRFGLANDSAKLNDVLKSSDLIGWQTITVQPHMVGSVLAVFVAAEAKEEGWTYSGTPREMAQLAFIELVIRSGGRAGFVTSTAQLDTLLLTNTGNT
jgi:hypothetical protein